MKAFYRQHKTTRERIDNLAQRLTRKAGRKVSSREVLGFAESRKFFPEVIGGHRCFPIGVADIIFEEMPLEVPAQVDKPLPTDEAIREAWYTMAAGYYVTGRTRLADVLMRSALCITDGNNEKAVKFSVENSAQLAWIKGRLLGEMRDSMADTLGDRRLLLLPEVGTPRPDAPAPAPAEGVLPGFPAPAPVQMQDGAKTAAKGRNTAPGIVINTIFGNVASLVVPEITEMVYYPTGYAIIWTRNNCYTIRTTREEFDRINNLRIAPNE